MKFDRTDEFAADWKSMPVDHRRIFRSLMPALSAACEAYVGDPGRPWPANLRVKPMINSNGIWETRHADVKITLKIYSHKNLDAMRQALGKLDGRLS